MKTKSLSTAIVLLLIYSSILHSQIIEYKLHNPDSIYFKQAPDSTANKQLLPAEKRVNDSLEVEYELMNPGFGIDREKKETPKRPNPVFKDKVIYNATDSTLYSLDGKKVFLFGDASITYEDIELKAAYIEVDMEQNILYAEGIADSAGVLQGQPVFTQGNETMQARSLTYNVKTEKGFIKGLYTEQEEGYLHSESTKKDPSNAINLYRGKYSTCELEDPHFYLWLSKGKVIPDKAIVASFSFLVIEDIPLYPIMVPFGFFPSTKEKASGFLIPKFGEENSRGFFLREGGYYFAFNDYFDLALKGDVYSKGTWLLGAQSKYKLRYKFNGSVNLAYSKVVVGEPDLLNYHESNEYRIQWTHAQDAKARPNSNFSASVNFSSMGNQKYNSTTSEDYLTNTTSSSISYRKTFANTPFSMSMSLRHSQNTRDSIVNLTLPQMTVNMNRIFPFRSKNSTGKAKWYENIGITYTGNFENRITAHDSIVFTPQVRDYLKNGIKHAIPLSTSLKVMKYFNLSPSINFTDRMYFNAKYKDAVYTDEGKLDTVLIREENGFYNIYDYSYSLGLGTTMYGMFQFKNKYLKAIRHVATPSVSMSFRPDFQQEKWGYYELDPSNTDTTRMVYYSPFSDNIGGIPGAGKSGSISFSLNNNVEMKVANKKDTTGTDSKVKILESLNFSTSYNMLAEEFNWAPLNISARTTLFKILSINMSATGNFYALDDSTGNPINSFHFKHNPGQPFRITSARASTGLTFNSNTLFGKDKAKGTENSLGAPVGEINDLPITGNPDEHSHNHTEYYAYDYFKIPWNLRVDYSLSYSKPKKTAEITQTMSFSGDFSLTPLWKIGFRSGWDFKAKDFSYTSFNLSRDLHCWVATLSLIPFGQRQSYNFAIGVKASVLQDLKYNKNRSWYDNAY